MSRYSEFQNGLEDLLKEKETVKFSWFKTTIVFVAFTLILMFSLSVGFQVLKKLVVVSPAPPMSHSELVKAQEATEPEIIESKLTPKPLVVQAQVSQKVNDQDLIKPKTEKVLLSNSQTTKTNTISAVNAQWYRVIAGSFQNTQQAQAHIKWLKRKGTSAEIWIVQVNNTLYYRVQADKFREFSKANALKKKLAEKGIDTFIVQK